MGGGGCGVLFDMLGLLPGKRKAADAENLEFGDLLFTFALKQ